MSNESQEKPRAMPQLSCELCRDRKVKCDKLDPCNNCLTAGVACVPVYRHRLPRGRHAHRPCSTVLSPASIPVTSKYRVVTEANEDLKDRIRRLEALVQNMSSARTAFFTPKSTAPKSAASYNSRRQEGPDGFWEDLVQEVEQLRDIVELRPGEADNEITETGNLAHSHPGGFDGGFTALGLSSNDSSPNSWSWAHDFVPLHQCKSSARRLCEIYVRQVDPIIKILHQPSLAKWMIHGDGYLGYPERHPATDALGAAICYSAANSMSEDQSLTMFNTCKSSIVADCRKACESALEKSNLLTTRDITVLQSFVLYLVARGSGERSRAVWTLIATAVRLAKALRLHLDLSISTGNCMPFFDQQIRKRLWLTICVLDLQTSLAHASKPLINVEEVKSALQLVSHINDSDFGPTTVNQVPDREGITDITFALVKFHLQVFGRQIGDGSSPSSFSAGLRLNWETANRYAQQFEQNALRLLHFCDPESSPYAWFTWHSTQLFISGARLSALRPLYRARASGQEVPPRMKDDTELLQHTIRALEKMELMHQDPRAESFRWMIAIQWHILAIAIAECYVCPDKVLVHRAWMLIESLYQRYETFITRNTGGSLQGPLGKLMRRTREKLAIYDGTEPPIDSAFRGQSVLPPVSAGLPGTSSDIIETVKSNREKKGQLVALTAATEGLSSPQIPLFTGPSMEDFVDTLSDEDIRDQSWKIWDEFMCDISFDELPSPGACF